MAIVYRGLRAQKTRLSASGAISTILATTTGTLNLSVSGLKITAQMSGGSGYLVSIYASTVPFGQQGGNLGTIITDPATGLLASDLQIGTYWNAPHWGTAYYLTVTLYNSSTVLATAMISTPAYVPGAPNILSVVPGPNSLTIEWQAVPNATSYNIYLGTTKLVNVPSSVTSFQYTALNKATQYKLGVQAVAPDVI